MKLIAGLGNPGVEYEHTRHNIGFRVLDLLAEQNRIDFDKKKGKSVYGKGSIAGIECILLKPQTYMNLSGSSVQEIFSFFNISIENCIIVHDDIDLPFSSVRIRIGGGHGGHNGIRNITTCLGSADFIRVKAGVGRPDNVNFPVDKYVLSNFNKDEDSQMEDFLIRMTLAVEKIISSGLNEAMNAFNKTGTK